MATVTITGQLLNGLNQPIVGEYVHFRVTGAGTDTTNDAVYPRKTFTLGPSDNSGDLPSDDIWVNGDSGVQSYYEVLMPGGERIDIVIPSGTSGTVDLSDLLGNSYRVTASAQVGATDKLNTIASLAVTDGNIIVGNGSTWVAESGATARTSLGLGTTDNVTFDDLNVSTLLEANNVSLTGGLDMQGGTITLDADDDTSITADTDDQIDFRIGGVDELTLTATKADNLDDLAALTPTDGNVIVGDGTDWVAESGNTARTSLGLGTGDTPTFLSATATSLLNTAKVRYPSGNSLTISNVTNGTIATFGNGASSTATAFNGSVDVDGNELILDADGDTSITADTDDQIDIRIGGVDELTLTAAKADNLDDIAALTPTDGNIIVGDGTDWVAESGATARTSLGLGTSNTPTFDEVTGTTKVNTQDVEATTSAGLTLSNSGGTTVATFGAGPGTGVSFAGGITLGNDLAVTHGGTGASTADEALDNLGMSHKIVAAGIHDWAGGASPTDSISVTGLEATDVIQCTLVARSASELLELAANDAVNDQIDLTLSANGTDNTTKIAYTVLRSTT